MTLQQAPGDSVPLATLVYLGRRARQAGDAAELRFIAVNETHMLAPYRQAALWLDGEGVAALSGVVSIDGNAPFVQWLDGVFRAVAEAPAPEEGVARVLAPDDLPEAARRDWGEWLPASVLWLPLPAVGARFPGGALLLARDEPWTPPEMALLGEWAGAWAASYAIHEPPALSRLWRRLSRRPDDVAPPPDEGRWPALRRRLRALARRPRTWLVAGLVVLALLPVRLTVLAPAELVPLDPAVIRSPLDGVIDRILVEPNQEVRPDDPLFEFDRTSIRNRLLVAQQALETARSEYRLRAQRALSDPDSAAFLAGLQGQIAEKTIEVDFLRDLDGRGTVVAPRAGVVLFDDPSEWIGRPVVTGERVMIVADAGEVEVEAWLSPANAVPLRDGAPVSLYLNADPLGAVEASLRYVGHEAVQRPDGSYAYRVRATLAGGDARARAGLKGTAKIAGQRVALLYWILRRPLADLRAWLGM